MPTLRSAALACSVAVIAGAAAAGSAHAALTAGSTRDLNLMTRRGRCSGTVDVLQGMSYSEDRLSQVDFSLPHTIVNHAVFARKDSRIVNSLEDLEGKLVAVHRGGIMHDYLVKKGLPFRDAHEAVARAVRAAEQKGCDLPDLPLAELQAFSPLIGADVFAVLTVAGSLAARDHVGGTAPNQVKAAIARLRKEL